MASKRFFKVLLIEKPPVSRCPRGAECRSCNTIIAQWARKVPRTTGTNNFRFNYAPYLPKNGKPGKFLPTKPRIVMCSRGYHLTHRPEDWIVSYAYHHENHVYVAEGYGKHISEGGYYPKTVFQSIRLLYEVKKGKDGIWRKAR